ncbi:bifunctional folylpolyglutamate synthase/dihydrofolate synthase [Sphingomonas sp. So64.6b]|uniref:bifunctional folylpolyglutamate synthase/dihydrofolate synthase n=1 Tax=Sphingomonas sp. So64.6b TaxID=2997354 RepID=UPI0016012ACE|nr:folylpolyglutamate synthase/dihydrofolate synthase family protein [Sphingomonas sp. So64.6b]QNA83578.1 bifunctional folylpolyglutamate synthase/dihydrofolate synthase [Sphingomonas sp. So64.6b]
MPDHASSSSPAVQAQLDRLWSLSPGADILGLERITALLARIGNPHHNLPPVIHVAGTNGKGSTCAFLRAGVEAAGLTAHVYTSPHLVRFNERIRIAGRLIEDDVLATLLAEVLDQADGIGASFFEVTTAAAFLAFSREPADTCIIEVGLGGRLDATNVIARPIVTGIAQLGVDHQFFLGDTAEEIAGEKAGIAKAGVPLVTMKYPPTVAQRVANVAGAANATVLAAGQAWSFSADAERLTYEDAQGRVETPRPRLAGPHQPENLALAIALLRHQDRLAIPPGAYGAAATNARWPARMQRLGDGPLVALLPQGSEVWLDGGHNPAAGSAIAAALAEVSLTPNGVRRPIQIILGMLSNKDPEGLLQPIAEMAESLTAVPVPDHEHHSPADLAQHARRLGISATATDQNVPDALRSIARRCDPRGTPPVVLILGSLYLAGEVLAANGEPPD